jgi:hypothetical protein
MPYVKPEDRKKYDKVIEAIKNLEKIDTKGDLEFIVFYLMRAYMVKREARYSTLHDVVYAVQHCADEFRRRFLDKREDEAKELNGDIEL